eukprot:Em0010g753a
MIHERGAILALVAIFICSAVGELCGELELFNCPNNNCISDHLVCDGKSDCVDGRDEQEDLCLMIDTKNVKELCSGTRHFSCLGNPCLPIYKVCDDINDCLYGTDERPSVCGRERFVRSPSIDTSGSGNTIPQCDPNPKILQGINDTTAPRGASVTFSCVASISAQSSKSKFIWTTTAKGIASLEGSDNRTACRISSTLVLNNVSTNNSGQYNCTAVTEEGNYTSNGYLQITGEPSCVAPQVTIHPTALSVPYGANAVFSCSVCYIRENISVTWLPPKGTLRATQNGSTFVSSLQLSAVDTSYRGNYSCIAKYANTSVSSTHATLTVVVPPLIIQTMSNQTALEKSDARLVCNASGAGVLAYSWRRLDTTLGTSAAVGTNSSVMTIHGVQLSDAGTYQCTVMDAAGQTAISNRATLQVSSEKPSLDAASPAVGIIAGSVTGAALMVVVVCVILLCLVVLHSRLNTSGPLIKRSDEFKLNSLN